MARPQATILFEPSDASFDDVSAAVGLAVKSRIAVFVGPRGDDGCNLPTAQIRADRTGTVSLVSCYALGPASLPTVGTADFRGRQKWFRKQAVVPLSSGGQNLQGD